MILLGFMLLGLGAGTAQASRVAPEDVATVGKQLSTAQKAIKNRHSIISTQERKLLAGQLSTAERALSRYRKLAGRDKSGVVAGAVLVAGALAVDDTTVIGVADDVFIPFILLGIMVAYLDATSVAYLDTHPTARPPTLPRIVDLDLDGAWRVVIDSVRAVAEAAKNISLTYVPPPRKQLKGFPSAERVIQRQGGRARWIERDTGRILEWDSQHGRVEVYNRQGKHLGEFDPETGDSIKPPNPGHKIKP